MSSQPLLLLLGAGPHIGNVIAQRFAQNGYNVAVVSRSGNNEKNDQGFFSIKADFADPASIPAVFAAARVEFGTEPSVVVYNAFRLTPPPEENALFSITAERLAEDLAVNTVSAFAAAREAVNGWDTLQETSKKTFIFTGNIQNVRHLSEAMFATIGVGKAATAYWVGSAAAAYSSRGYRFFYADQRKPDGDLTGAEANGEAHADFYVDLAAGGEDVPWHATFVKGKGYVKF